MKTRIVLSVMAVLLMTACGMMNEASPTYDDADDTSADGIGTSPSSPVDATFAVTTIGRNCAPVPTELEFNADSMSMVFSTLQASELNWKLAEETVTTSSTIVATHAGIFTLGATSWRIGEDGNLAARLSYRNSKGVVVCSVDAYAVRE